MGKKYLIDHFKTYGNNKTLDHSDFDLTKTDDKGMNALMYAFYHNYSKDLKLTGEKIDYLINILSDKKGLINKNKI